MSRLILILIALQGFTGSLGADIDDEENVDPFEQATVKGVPGNLISSPIGASSILFMLAYGARGGTESTLKERLHFISDENAQKDALKSLIEDINTRKPDPLEFPLINGLIYT